MMYFSSNIKLLRKRLGRTQDDIAFSLGMKRPTLSGYENGIAVGDGLPDGLARCGGPCGAGRTELATKAACAALLGSAVMLVQ